MGEILKARMIEKLNIVHHSLYENDRTGLKTLPLSLFGILIAIQFSAPSFPSCCCSPGAPGIPGISGVPFDPGMPEYPRAQMDI